MPVWAWTEIGAAMNTASSDGTIRSATRTGLMNGVWANGLLMDASSAILPVAEYAGKPDWRAGELEHGK